jgi:hypothetical protein
MDGCNPRWETTSTKPLTLFSYWRNLQLKTQKRSDFGGFQSPEVRRLKSPNSDLWLSLCSQKSKRKIKD